MQRGGEATVGQALALLTLIVVVTAGVVRAPDTEAQRGARIGQAAPEITGGPWLNSAPLSLAGLRGRVVLVEFWTYG